MRFIGTHLAEVVKSAAMLITEPPFPRPDGQAEGAEVYIGNLALVGSNGALLQTAPYTPSYCAEVRDEAMALVILE